MLLKQIPRMLLEQIPESWDFFSYGMFVYGEKIKKVLTFPIRCLFMEKKKGK